ncbi:MAG: T9SS type A sorting domain-containing protein [Saprospiraceae bacterium]|nr:T9SS type A sorting domain-containing protein [Saprospiraceae bacterium]MBK8372771.1 T9SS type A sorting domain-containing protein [Saprospiraceae bacterium]
MVPHMSKKNSFSSLVVIFLITFATTGVYAQILSFDKCGHHLVMETYEKKYPGFKEAVETTFENVRNIKNSGFSRNDVYIIDVVFHIVWKDSRENLHDSIILNQLAVLNKDYRLLNENRNEIRSIFKDLQTDAKIEFNLKEIIRVKTNANFQLSLSGLPDNVKNASEGGSKAVTPENVLNIWVCNIRPIPFIGGQILGYAYPPAGLDNWPANANAPSPGLDGVVLDFRVVGSNNPNILNVQGMDYDSHGRTCVHEVGHYLGLRHIWGDGGGIFGGSSCSVDDGMEDTPNQGEQTGFSCNKTRNTCTDVSNDLPDMLENYMDYSDESCQNIFTEDQVSHMRKVLENQRKGLIESQVNTSEINNYSFIKVSPNPGMGEFTIHYTSDSRVLLYTVYDISGKLLLSANPENDKQFKVFVSPGIYYINIIDVKGISTSTRFISY